MDNDARIEALAQKIFRTWNGRKNRVTGTQLTEFISTSIEWVNEFLPELEKEAYWSWSRENDYEFGSASTSSTTFDLDDDIRTIVKMPERPVYLKDSDGVVKSTWQVVNPNVLRNMSVASSEDRCAVVGRQLVFSRNFTAEEAGATVYGDVMYYLPELSSTNVEVLDLVDPVELIILGVAKNQALPNVVKGGLTPSLTQKYADLLAGAKQENDTSAQPEDSNDDNLSFIQGVW